MSDLPRPGAGVCRCDDCNYQDLVAEFREFGSKETPDGCRWDDPAIDGLAICQMMDDL
jgi:hypothetical protein